MAAAAEHDLTTTFEWNSLLRCSSPHLAVSLYARSMLSSSVPNKFTFTFLLRAAISLRQRHLIRLIHSHILVSGHSSDPFLRASLISTYSHLSDLRSAERTFFQSRHPNDEFLQTSLVSAYARCRQPAAALAFFNSMESPSPVSFAALLTAFSDDPHTVVQIFENMRRRAVPSTAAALVSALSAAARLPSLRHGLLAHHEIITSKVSLSPAVGTALLNMYARCGRLDDANKVFDEMPLKDHPSWAAMISALGSHGRAGEALILFDKMLGLGLVPDHITWVAVLHACSHAGLVNHARNLFDKMVCYYGVIPKAEHYGCLVDTLGRAGQAEEAWELVKNMPVVPDERVLKCVLSACCEKGFVDGAKWAVEKLIEIDAGNSSAYVLLSNLYAGIGRWNDVARVRKLMRVRGVPKSPGSSAI